ncbi:MAG: porin [Gammaproteobacteria bacterium]|nr:porin [Gammaproteobacteria bacterium]
MNKKLLTVAVSAAIFAVPMMAQAETAFYGNLQYELASVDDGATSIMTNADNKRGRLGVKADEDLGNGLKAVAKFEWQVDTTDASIPSGTRESWVGLSGNFGTVSAGSVQSPYKYYGGMSYDAFGTTLLEARSNGGLSGKDTDMGTTAGGAFGHHGFIHNAISYKGTFDAIEVWVVTSLDEAGINTAGVGGDDKGSDGDLAAGIKFSQDNFEVFAAMANDDNGADIGGAQVTDSYSATKFGGMFKMGDTKIFAQMESTTAEPTSGAPDYETDIIFVGVNHTIGKNTLVAQLGQADDDSANTLDYMALGVIHKFSKKTRAFVGYGTSSDDDAGPNFRDDTVIDLGLRVDF